MSVQSQRKKNKKLTQLHVVATIGNILDKDVFMDIIGVFSNLDKVLSNN